MALPVWTLELRRKIVALVEPYMVPRGGATSQILTKISDADYDADWVTGSGGGGTTDHGLLDGPSLLDDDHPQYHTDSRGDARYYRESEVDVLLDGKSDDPHDHAAAETVSGSFANARISESSVTQHEGAIDHDALDNFLDGEHRIINDAGFSLTELMSSEEIKTQLAGKSDDPHGHDHGIDLIGLEGLDHPQYTRKNGWGLDAQSTVVMSFDDGTRTFTIAPTGAEFEYWSAGIRRVKSAPADVVIDDISGLWFIYFVGNTLTASRTPWDIEQDEWALVAVVYWYSSGAVHNLLGVELHTWAMDPATHGRLHHTVGSAYASGLAPGNMITDGGGNLDSHAQVSVGNGVFYDEDIKHTIDDGAPQDLAPIANLPIYYHVSTLPYWVKLPATDFVVHPFGGTGRASWNQELGGTWGLSEVGNNQHVLMHLYASNSNAEPMVLIMGQDTYLTRGQAQAGALVELESLNAGAVAALSPEFIPVATFIIKTADSYTNAVQSQIITTDDGGDYIDWRTSGGSREGASSITDHGGLSGLADDDHPQYHTEDRASTWLRGDGTADPDAIKFELEPVTSMEEGMLRWSEDDGTLELGLPGGNVNLQIGQEHVVKCRNTTGVPIANGAAVYISGASGNMPLIALSKADDKSTAILVGLATEEIAHNSNGYVTVKGLVRDINTSAFAAGSYVFLSDSVAGGYATSPAGAPSYKARIGYCIVSSIGAGVILVDSGVVNKLTSLSDFNGGAQDATNKHVVWNNAAEYWEPDQIEHDDIVSAIAQHRIIDDGSVLDTDLLSAFKIQGDLSGKSNVGHGHDLSDVSDSGELAAEDWPPADGKKYVIKDDAFLEEGGFVIPGGTIGQVMSKTASGDYTMGWSDQNDISAIHDDETGEVNALASKAALVAADVLMIEDSDSAVFDKKKVTPGGISHDLLADSDGVKHRIINDAGATTTELFSSSHIETRIATRSATGHGHLLADIGDSGDLAPLDEITAALVDAGASSDGQVLTSDGAGAAAWETPAGGGGDPVIPFIHLTKTVSASQNVGGANGTVTYIDWDSRLYTDTSKFTHSLTVNISRIEVDEDGAYEICAAIPITQGGTGRTSFIIGYRVNGSTIVLRGSGTSYSRGSAYGDARPRLVTVAHLSAGDYIEILVKVDDTDSSYTSNTIYAECEVFVKKLT